MMIAMYPGDMDVSQQDGQDVQYMNERQVVGKYTLIPAGLLVAAILLTIGAMNWYHSQRQTERERIVTLEIQQKQTDTEIGKLNTGMAEIKAKMEGQTNYLSSISRSITVMEYHLGLGTKPGQAPRPAPSPSP